MHEDEAIQLTREELYEQVWSTPMRTLCREYGLSDNGLRKICKRHHVPTPRVGYWAKLEHGKRVTKLMLPSIEDEALSTITICKCDTPPEAERLSVEYDDDIMCLLKRVKEAGPYQVGDTLRGAHPLIRAVKDALTNASPDEHELILARRPRAGDVPSVVVSKESVPRALRFMDALIKAIESVGGKIEFDGDRWHRRTVVNFAGEKASTIRLRERYNQRPNDQPKESDIFRRKWRFVPNGLLLLDQGPSSYRQPYCADTVKATCIESQIGEVLTKLVQEAGEARIRRRAREQQRRHEADLRSQREKLQAEQVAERRRIEGLLAEANALQQSEILRSYIRVVKRNGVANGGRFQSQEAIDAWIEWASNQADRIDPLVDSPPSILDKGMNDPWTGSYA